MSDHNVLTCAVTGKIMYASLKAANLASIAFKRRKQRPGSVAKFRSDEPALHSYHCQYCASYHNGHATGKKVSTKQRARMARGLNAAGRRRKR